MTKKIVLNKAEIAVIEKYFRGEITMFGTSEEDMATMIPVINAAEKLMLETKEDIGDDLIRWYWNLYKTQESTTE